MTEPVGCTDHDCVLRLEKRGGMGTNGGCDCLDFLPLRSRMIVRGWRRSLIAQRAVIAALRDYVRATDEESGQANALAKVEAALRALDKT